VDERWIVFVTCGRWQRSGLAVAKSLGFKIIGVDGDEYAQGRDLVDQFLCVDINNVEQAWPKVAEAVVRKQVVASLSICSDAGMPLVAVINEQLGLSGPGIELTHALTNKLMQRRIWEHSGVASPRYAVVDGDHPLSSGHGLSYPLIVKPVDSAGSRGVSKVFHEGELDVAVGAAMGFSGSRQVIIEEVIEGDEFAVEVFIQNGECEILSMSRKGKVSGTNGTVAQSYLNLKNSSTVSAFIRDQIPKAYAALGYRDGVGHAEIIVNEDGEGGLVEVAGRGGGFNVFGRYVQFVSGFDLPRAVILRAVGESVPVVMTAPYYAAMEFFPSTKGVVKSISGMESFDDDDIYAESFVVPGQHVGGAISDGDRLGCVMVRSRTVEGVMDKMALAKQRIQFKVE